MSNFVSAERVIRSALEDYGLTNDRYFNAGLRWVEEAVLSVGQVPAYNVMVFEQDLDGSCNTIDKPKGYLSARSIELCKGNETTEVSYAGASPSELFDPEGCCTFYNRRRKFMDERAVSMGESPTHFFFQDGSPADWDRISIEYYGLGTDEKGYVMVPVYADRAVQQYIHYKLTGIDRRRDRTKVSQQEVNDAYKLWLGLKGDAYGNMQTTSIVKMREMTRSRFFKRMTTPEVRRYNGPASLGSSTSTTQAAVVSSGGSQFNGDQFNTDQFE